MIENGLMMIVLIGDGDIFMGSAREDFRIL
jgi:hypothetical protein